MKLCVSIGGFLRDCNLVFKGMSDKDCQVCVCVLYSGFCVVICGEQSALSGHCLV